MKMRKVLALLLTLVLVFAVAAFAQEGGDSADPASPSAGRAAGTTEAAATQAFQRSLDVYGVYTWRYEYNSFKGDTDTPLWRTNGQKYVTQSSIRHMIEANFTYKVSEKLQIKFGLAWGAYYGGGRSRGFYSQGQGSYLDDFANLGNQEFDSGSINSSTGRDIKVKSLYIVWKMGFLGSQLQLGRMDTTWGYHSVFYGSYAGADRVLWIGNMKLFGMTFLPLAYFELRDDNSSAMGDEQLLMSVAFIAVAPGKLLEQLWVTFGYYMPTERGYTGAAGKGTLRNFPGFEMPYDGKNLFDLGNGYAFKSAWKFFSFDAYVKLRIGNLLVINFEVMANFGSAGKTYAYDSTTATVVGAGTEKNWTVFAVLLNAEVKLGFLKITPEVVMITAPKYKGTKNADGTYTLETNKSAGGWMPRYIDYQVGGRLLSTATNNLLGMYEGLLSFSVKLEASLGKITPWIKFSYMAAMSKIFQTCSGGYRHDGAKTLGFEVDLGLDIQLADGFSAGLELGYAMLGKRLTDNGEFGLYNANAPSVGVKSALGAVVKFDLKF